VVGGAAGQPGAHHAGVPQPLVDTLAVAAQDSAPLLGVGFELRLEGSELAGGTDINQAIVPLLYMIGDATDLCSKTQGSGRVATHFGPYEEVPLNLAGEIISLTTAFNPDRSSGMLYVARAVVLILRPQGLLGVEGRA